MLLPLPQNSVCLVGQFFVRYPAARPKGVPFVGTARTRSERRAGCAVNEFLRAYHKENGEEINLIYARD
jgi:hypothetical protein